MEQAEHESLNEINAGLAMLFGFARSRDEVDFALSLTPENRGMQDAGWNTAEEALFAFREGLEMLDSRGHDRATIRNLLYRYLCIAEASGLYEVLRNCVGILQSDVYKLWPFINIVEKHRQSGKVVAPNANRVFRELSKQAEAVGLTKLSRILATVFDDDVRNAVAHADFIIWRDGLRLRRRNGGMPYVLNWQDLSRIIRRGFCFVDLLIQYRERAIWSYEEPRSVVGRGSANKTPSTWKIHYDKTQGSFSISTSSPGGQKSPQFLRAEYIKSLLGNRVLVVVAHVGNSGLEKIASYYEQKGIVPVTKLYESEREYDNFIRDLSSVDDSIFLARASDAQAAVVITPLGAIQTVGSDLDLVLPEVPDFETGETAAPVSS